MPTISMSKRVLLGVLPFAMLVACDNSTGPKKDVTPAAIAPASTDTLRGLVAADVNTPLTVTVKNAAGQPIDSALVTFAIASGGGSLAATNVRTDSLGRASTTWTLGPTAGIQTVTAVAGTLQPITFVAVASAAAASTLTKSAGDNQSAAAGSLTPVAPAVKVTDRFGNPVRNVAVSFTVASGGGSVTGSSATSDSTGIATVGGWRLGPTVGTNTLTASAQGAGSVTFSATGTVGAVAQIRFTNTAPTLSVNQTFKFTVQALDANNNVVPNVAITFATDNPAVATVDASGTVTAKGGGTATISASSGSVTASQVVSVIGNPGGTVVATVAMGSRIRNVAIAGNVAYAALSISNTIAAVDLTSGTVLWTLDLGQPIIDVAVNSANNLVTALGAGATPELFIVSPSTRKAIDSVALAAPPVRMVMTASGTRALVDENNFQLEVIDIASRSVVSQMPLSGTVKTMKLAAGDTVAYAGTALGLVYELNASTGAVRRTFQPSTTVNELDIAHDGKTLFVTDGSSSVTMVRLATGGLSGSVDFGGTVSGVAVTPDLSQMWVTMLNQILSAPSTGTSFDSSVATTVATITGTQLGRIFFNSLGSIAIVIDDAGNQLVILK